MKKQTAGRTNLGDFAPKFAELNDDVLFGEVWSREDRLSARDRSLVTVTALMAQGLTDISFRHHLEMAKANGITRAGPRRGRRSGWPRRSGWRRTRIRRGRRTRTPWFSPSARPTTASASISSAKATSRQFPRSRLRCST